MNLEMSLDQMKIKERIAQLQDAILSTHPSLPIILKDIHTLLKGDPACVTLLEEDEIAAIVSGLKKQTLTEITQATLKKKTSLKNVSLADL